MRVTKTSKLQIKTSCGLQTFEVLRITKSGVDCREEKYSGMDRMATGYTSYGMAAFWDRVRSGAITIIEAG